MYSHHFTPIHTSRMGRTARLRSLKASASRLPVPERPCFITFISPGNPKSSFFTWCPFIRVLYFFLYFRVRRKTNQTLRCRCVRLRGGSTGAAGALIKGAKKGSCVKVPRRDEAPAVSRVCISQPVALPRWS